MSLCNGLCTAHQTEPLARRNMMTKLMKTLFMKTPFCVVNSKSNVCTVIHLRKTLRNNYIQKFSFFFLVEVWELHRHELNSQHWHFSKNNRFEALHRKVTQSISPWQLILNLNLPQPRTTWKENLSEGLARSGWPVSVFWEIISMVNWCRVTQDTVSSVMSYFGVLAWVRMKMATKQGGMQPWSLVFLCSSPVVVQPIVSSSCLSDFPTWETETWN